MRTTSGLRLAPCGSLHFLCLCVKHCDVITHHRDQQLHCAKASRPKVAIRSTHKPVTLHNRLRQPPRSLRSWHLPCFLCTQSQACNIWCRAQTCTTQVGFNAREAGSSTRTTHGREDSLTLTLHICQVEPCSIPTALQ